jgi:hypothetical protein
MPISVIITLTTAGSDTGPFDLFSNTDSYNTAFATNVPKSSLVAGYATSAVPDGTATIRVKSKGTCTNYVDLAVPQSTPSPTAVSPTSAPTTAAPTTAAPTTAAPTTSAPTTVAPTTVAPSVAPTTAAPTTAAPTTAAPTTAAPTTAAPTTAAPTTAAPTTAAPTTAAPTTAAPTPQPTAGTPSAYLLFTSDVLAAPYDYVTTTTRFRHYNGSAYVTENFSDFLGRKITNNDRITPYGDVCANKATYTYALNYPQGTGESSTSIQAYIIHPTSMGTITEMVDVNNPTGIFNPVSITSNAEGTFTYNGVNYRMYKILSAQNPTGGTLFTLKVTTCT